MSWLSEISFEPLEPYDGKLSCTVLRGGKGQQCPRPTRLNNGACFKVNLPIDYTSYNSETNIEFIMNDIADSNDNSSDSNHNSNMSDGNISVFIVEDNY